MPLQVTFEHLSGSREGVADQIDRESILIGRGEPNDIALDPFADPTVSSQHAEIRLEAGEAVLYDMGSLNGTYLNGVAVRRAELHEGDHIALGRQGPRMRVQLGQVGGNGSARAVQMPAVSVDPGRTVPEEILAVELGDAAADRSSRSPFLYMVLGGAVVAAILYAVKTLQG